MLIVREACFPGTIWARHQIQLGVNWGLNYSSDKGQASLRGAEGAQPHKWLGCILVLRPKFKMEIPNQMARQTRAHTT
jgi:hypothetical protein